MRVAAVIMAGGRGERFWPVSREDRPKQFLAFDGEETLIQRTVNRLRGLCSPAETWVVTRADFANLVREQLPEVPERQILLEPQGRDTAPCLALAALHLAKLDTEAVMVVLPADHLILQEQRFREMLAAAVQLAQSGDHLITLGIRPTRPETGYGYICMGEACGSEAGVYQVAGFTEKPLREQAMAYLQSGCYLWNSGIFVWRVSTITAALQRYLPELMDGLASLAGALGTEREAGLLEQVYPTLPKISIDYGVMEKATNTLVIPADFGWDDLGTWPALDRVVPANEDGNIVLGRVLALETRDSILQSSADGRVLVSFGVSDLVVVDTPDAVLVADKHRAGDLKAVVGRLEAEGLKQHLRLPTESDAAK